LAHGLPEVPAVADHQVLHEQGHVLEHVLLGCGLGGLRGRNRCLHACKYCGADGFLSTRAGCRLSAGLSTVDCRVVPSDPWPTLGGPTAMEAATPLRDPSVRTIGDRLAIDGLVVADECAVRLVREGDDPVRTVEDAIEIGARELDREQAGANAEF